MPVYRVFYLNDEGVERFRAKGPPASPASLRPRDYALVAEIQAPNEYAVWRLLQGPGASERNLRPMRVGDVLEAEPGRPRVCRFVGFDDAAWFVFEPKPKTPAAGGDEASATPTATPSETASEPSGPDNPSDRPR